MIMEANELRIGNYVWEEYGGIYKVININSEGFDYVDLQKPTFKALGRFDIYSIKGIPLTEEKLLKCGFKKGIRGWFKTYGNNYKFNLYMYNSKCENLHQLQNLYFALTNEELTINL